MFTRVAVVNRGAAAMRAIRAIRELNEQRDLGIKVIALHTNAERRSLFVRSADESVSLRAVTTAGGPYVDYGELERALQISRADAAWVGWDFVAHDPGFAELCERLGVLFVGASSQVMRKVGVDQAALHAHLSAGVRHIDVQVIADNHGAVWAPGISTRSVTRRNRVLVVESGSPRLGTERDAALRGAAVALIRDAGLRGAATVEFCYRLIDNVFTVVAVQAGLPASHAVTEATTGLDLVKLQLLVAAGEPLPGDAPPQVGYAVEARLDAQDADRDFAPTGGTLLLLELPAGPGIRADTGHAVGDPVPPEFDSPVARITASGRDRREALARLRCALRETKVVLSGGLTTKPFLLDQLDLLGRPDVASGPAGIGWLERADAPMTDAPRRYADIALLGVAIDVYDAEEEVDRAAFIGSARRGRPRADDAVGRTVELRYRARTYRFDVARVGPRRYRIEIDGRLLDVDIERMNAFESRLTLGPRHFRLLSVAGAVDHLVEVEGVAHRISSDRGRVLRAPGPAVVVAIHVKAGDDVEEGAAVAVLESMKMETQVRAPCSGRVRSVLVGVNSQVDAGAALLQLDSSDGLATSPDAPTVSFVAPPSASDSLNRARTHLAALRAMITGYDVSAKRARTLVAEYLELRGELAPDDVELRREELALVTVFADLCELSRNRPTSEEEAPDERVHSPRENFHIYLYSLDANQEHLPERFRTDLTRALRHYGVEGLGAGRELEEAVYRIFLSHQREGDQLPVVSALLERWLRDAAAASAAVAAPADAELFRDEIAEVLAKLIIATQVRYPAVGDLARSIRFRLFDEPLILQVREAVYAGVREHLQYLDENPDAADYPARIEAMAASPEPLIQLLAQRIGKDSAGPNAMLEVLCRRYYKVRTLDDVRSFEVDGWQFLTGAFELRGRQCHLISTIGDISDLPALLRCVAGLTDELSDPANVVVDLYLAASEWLDDADSVAASLRDALAGVPARVVGRRVTITVCDRDSAQVLQFTYRPLHGRLEEDRDIRGIHPLIGQRLGVWRLTNFVRTRLSSTGDTYLFHCVAPDNASDERLVALAEVRDVTPLRDASGQVVAFPAVERTLSACLESIRGVRATHGAQRRLEANRIFLYVWPPIEVPFDQLGGMARAMAPLAADAGLEEVMVVARLRGQLESEPTEVALLCSCLPSADVAVTVTEPPTEPLAPLSAYTEKVRSSRARGAVYPYEIVPLVTGPDGAFVEHDLGADGRLVPVDRPPGHNAAGIVVGVVSTPSHRYPEGMVRVALFGDPTKSLGSVAEPECARIIAALDLAAEMGVPVEWFALSSGAKISMDSGTENMDWVARTLRRLITFTQAGHEVNVIVAGINVGAQPYWNAEATMLLHTKGILIMTPDSAMVLTGKHSLEYSGGVSAEDNLGIGGYDRVMGPNGQAQYWAPNLTAACATLFAHYDHTYVAPEERFPRRAETSDPRDRDVRGYPHVHPDSDFTTVGDIFSAEVNQERKKPFDIRSVMRAVVDQDHPVLERWVGMADADTSIVFDAHLGGYPVALLGIESRPIPRRGEFPADGPDQWTAGTLFPRSSKKTARAINAASGNRPLVVLANLSGFDGSPESLRKLQLEYGAEIGRAIVNFDGPIVFCVISRYHGGAFVVFSGVLNDNMEVVAVEGSFASVIGGAPAAAVVFSREVATRTARDSRVATVEASLADADEGRTLTTACRRGPPAS